MSRAPRLDASPPRVLARAHLRTLTYLRAPALVRKLFISGRSIKLKLTRPPRASEFPLSERLRAPRTNARASVFGLRAVLTLPPLPLSTLNISLAFPRCTVPLGFASLRRRKLSSPGDRFSVPLNDSQSFPSRCSDRSSYLFDRATRVGVPSTGRNFTRRRKERWSRRGVGAYFWDSNAGFVGELCPLLICSPHSLSRSRPLRSPVSLAVLFFFYPA